MPSQIQLTSESADIDATADFPMLAVGSAVDENGAALCIEWERAQATLNSMGDGVISTNTECRVTYLNAVAEQLTGWSCSEAIGRPLEEVFQPLDADTRLIAPNSMAKAISTDTILYLAPNCVLVRRDGQVLAIEDSAAPVHDRTGRVTGAVMIVRDVSAARALARRNAHLAEHDGLTGLSNRSSFADHLEQSLALARRNGHKLAVLYLDLDSFKQVNDTLGHDIGDRLLQSVGQRLIQCVRGSDTVGRQGGDEFLILLSEVGHAADAEVVADKILDAIAVPHRINGRPLTVTASIGIAIWPDDDDAVESLVRQADAAMYGAKSAGGNRYQRLHASDSTAELQRRRPLPGDPASVAGSLITIRAGVQHRL
jgi:diguanylate cyclase (GGDEF)-like protein/PAS domain S-box-containing protein